MVCNMAMPILGRHRRLVALQRLIRVMSDMKRMNEHTHAMVFIAYNDAGRLDLALQYFDLMCRCGGG